MDPILSLPPTLPPHHAAELRPVPHRIVAEWPTGTFLENLAVLDDGALAVSILSDARIDRVTLAGERSTLRQFVAPVTGLATAGGQAGSTRSKRTGVSAVSGRARRCVNERVA